MMQPTLTLTLTHFLRAGAALLGLTLALSQPARAQAVDDQLYQRLGAQAGIDKIVHDFIPIVLADPRINSFFRETDMDKLAKLLAEQFCQLAGGPCSYSGRDMVGAHDGMGVRLAHFNALAEDLQQSMEDNHVDAATANKLIGRLAPLQRAIVR
jgi:hemoglobin